MALNNKANLTIAIVVGMGIIALTGLTFIDVVRKKKRKICGLSWAQYGRYPLLEQFLY